MARITPCLENGKIARFRPRDEISIGFGSTEFIVIRGEKDVTTDDFAYYLTKWNEFRQFAIGQMTGSSGRQGKIVVVQLRDEVDPESGERYTVKRYRSERRASEEGWRHTQIVLRPDNHKFEPIVLMEPDEGKRQVVAELVEVLGSRKEEAESPHA